MGDPVKREYTVIIRGDDDEISLVEDEIREVLNEAEEAGLKATLQMTEEIPLDEDDEEEEDGDGEDDE